MVFTKFTVRLWSTYNVVKKNRRVNLTINIAKIVQKNSIYALLRVVHVDFLQIYSLSGVMQDDLKIFDFIGLLYVIGLQNIEFS